MVSIIVALLVVVAASAVLYLKYRLDHVPDGGNLEAAIDAEVLKFSGKVSAPGLVVGVYRDGRSLIKGFGTSGGEKHAVPDATTIFQIGSVSKVFTASLLQVLCDEGTLSMDATLGELIGKTVTLSPAARQVTLRQLVTHTSGFPRIPKPIEEQIERLVGKDKVMLDPYSHLGTPLIFDYLAHTEDMNAPGRFEYSNFGMGLLGHVLEMVTHREFESLVIEKVLAPLNMPDTRISLTHAMTDNLAQGYTEKGEPAPLWTFAALAGAGAFNANARDMLSFIRANIEDKASITPSLHKMHAPQSGGSTGIGWMQPTLLDRFFGNRTIVWHNGMVGGYASYLSIDPHTRTGTVVLSNRALDVTMLGMMLTRQVRTQSWSD